MNHLCNKISIFMKCTELKFVFIDICKNAGTSIIETFKSNFPTCAFEGKHHSIRNYNANITCSVLTDTDINDYTLFTVVRNPFDRMVSLYHWGLNSEYNTSFPQFMERIRDGNFPGYHEKPRYRIQLDWIRDSNGEIRVPHILRYENLQEDFNLFCTEKLKLPAMPMIKTNTAFERSGKDRMPYRHYYGTVEKDIIHDVYGGDLTAFNYDF